MTLQQKKAKNEPSRFRSNSKWGFGFVLLLLVLLVVRMFFIGSYRIATNSMAEALHSGDYVLVNKVISGTNPGRNRIILFSSPLLADSVHRPLFASRCIGMPGDTIQVNNEGYLVNGIQYPYSPYSLHIYQVDLRIRDQFIRGLRPLSIPRRGWVDDENGIQLQLTLFEEFQIREELKEEENNWFSREPVTPYTLVVPKKNIPYRLDPSSLAACAEAIQNESGGKAGIQNHKLYLNGIETAEFTFSQDYYWVLSDNVTEAIDSRYLGFIPAGSMIGNIWFCWYSTHRDRLFRFIK